VAEYAQGIVAFERAEKLYNELLAEWRQRVGETAARAEWKRLHSRYKISELGTLTGEQSEGFLRTLFVKMGYKATLTRKTGDQGADLIVSRPKGRIAVQAKRQHHPVGNRAVQELLGGILYYKCQKGIVATTSTFTRSARSLAAKDQRLALWDARKLSQLYAEYLGVAPPFSWEEYNRLKNTLAGDSD
jgi:HJR/Mrr/RecB family endonuclease